MFARIRFRFVFSYFVLYYLPFPLTAIPVWGDRVVEIFDLPRHALLVWFAANVLHLDTPITIFTNGSGDTTYDWVLVLVDAVLAMFATAVWTALDRRRPSDDLRVRAAFRVYVRYALATYLLTYGAL